MAATDPNKFPQVSAGPLACADARKATPRGTV